MNDDSCKYIAIVLNVKSVHSSSSITVDSAPVGCLLKSSQFCPNLCSVCSHMWHSYFLQTFSNRQSPMTFFLSIGWRQEDHFGKRRRFLRIDVALMRSRVRKKGWLGAHLPNRTPEGGLRNRKEAGIFLRKQDKKRRRRETARESARRKAEIGRRKRREGILRRLT